MWQTDSAAHKLKPRLFYKSAYLQVYSADFHSGVNCAWQLENKNIHLNWPSKKLDNKRYRPFRISKDIGLGAFELELPEGWMIHNVFNEDLLTWCTEPKFKGQHMEPAPPPTIINEEEEYEIEEVRKHWKWGKGVQYLVHWKGYGDEHDQWIAESGLPYARQAIEDYWTRYLSQNL